MRTGDVVRHEPTGETWVVAFCEDGRVAPMGWPMCLAKESDCTLTDAASDGVHKIMLEELAAMNDTRDMRCRYARRTLLTARTLEDA